MRNPCGCPIWPKSSTPTCPPSAARSRQPSGLVWSSVVRTHRTGEHVGVYLTAGGRDALERLRAVQRAEIVAAIADWVPEDQQRFAELMSRFAFSFLAWAV